MQHVVVIAATPLFCYFTILGSLLLMSSVYVWTLYENSFTCHMKMWSMQLGFTWMFGALLIKTVRIWLVVDGRQYEAPRVKQEQLLWALAGLLGFEV